MYRTFNLYRLIGTGFVAVALVFCVGFAAAQTATLPGNTQADLDRIYYQIVSLRDADLEVPAELYQQYFALQKILNPVNEYRGREGHLDQAMDGCPGTLITQPAPGTVFSFFDAGQTNNANNNCTYDSLYPKSWCRRGRDVHYKLVMNHPEFLRISTCGSRFDTYLCIFKDSCCAFDSTLRFASVQDNNGVVCGATERLTAVLDTCFLMAGTYYITLDGANQGAFGDYQFRITGLPDRPCEAPIPCTQGYFAHSEAQHPNEEVCESAVTVNCGDGYCGVIDRIGDRDVYRFTLTDCAVVTLSAFANDTPARSGYHKGLNPMMRLFAGPACDHPQAYYEIASENY